MTPRIAMVVQRYGTEVNGGAEYECRSIAELMKDDWAVDVLTTCALDYMTWSNHYSEGVDRLNGVTIHRFPVDKPRDIVKFNRLSDAIINKPHSHEDEISWMREQGPNAPKLFDYIRKNRDNYTLFIFFTYLYGTTYWGLPAVADKSILVPLAHNEPPAYLSIFQELFRQPIGFIFNTPEEKDFVVNTRKIKCPISDIIGIPVDTSRLTNHNDTLSQNLPTRYVIYVGRIDESKGCGQLFGFWAKYKQYHSDELSLLLLGRPQFEIPHRDDVIPLGFVSEAEKYSFMRNAECLIMPSRYESLSIVLLESWIYGRPVLVNGKCAVLREQCRRSNGGLWYENYEEFENCLKLILENKSIAHRMGENGKKYTIANYAPETIKKKYVSIVERVMENI